jgi:hypothetical protein
MWVLYLALGLAVIGLMFLLTYAIDVDGSGRGD